jgi:hypothetical protein
MSWGVEPKLARTGGAASAHTPPIAAMARHRLGLIISLITIPIGLWIEVQNDALPAEVGQLQRPPVLVGALEVGRLVTRLIRRRS